MRSPLPTSAYAPKITSILDNSVVWAIQLSKKEIQFADEYLGLSKGPPHQWRDWRASIQVAGRQLDGAPRQGRPVIPTNPLARFRFLFQGSGLSFTWLE